MKLTISETCIACGLCSDTYPELFRMNDDKGMAEVVRDPQDEAEQEQAKEAADACPSESIQISS